MKKRIIISMLVGTLFLSGCSCSRNNGDNDRDIENNNENATVITDENVVGEKNVDGIVFENTTFKIEEGVSSIVTKVTNRSGAAFTLENYQMTVTDSNGQILTILTSTVNENLEIDEEKYYTTPCNLDLSKAAKVEYSINVTIPE